MGIMSPFYSFKKWGTCTTLRVPIFSPSPLTKMINKHKI